jgi:signal peptidase I
MKVLNRIFKIFSSIVIAAIVLYVAIAAPIVLGYRPVVVLSGSMEPTYPVGSVIYYHKCSFDELSAGDAITFQAEGALVTHRINTVNEISRTVVTQGDNNLSEDPVPVEENEIIGKATKFAIPYAGYFVNYGKKPISIAVMAAILFINYALEIICSKQKGEKRNAEEKTE